MIREEDDEALLCLTDLYQFCTECTQEVGQWYFPNGSAVQNVTLGNAIYMSRSRGVVRLHHRNNGTVNIPNGLYNCTIEDSNGTTQSVYIFIHNESLPTTSSMQSDREETGTVATFANGTDLEGNESPENGAAGNGAIVLGVAGAGGFVLLFVAGIVLTILLISR